MPSSLFQELRNLLHHGTEQITEFFEILVGTEKVFYIVNVSFLANQYFLQADTRCATQVQAQTTLSGVTADCRER